MSISKSRLMAASWTLVIGRGRGGWCCMVTKIDNNPPFLYRRKVCFQDVGRYQISSSRGGNSLKRNYYSNDAKVTPHRGDEVTEVTSIPSELSACSRMGLLPNINRFHAPIVYHENYSFEGWPKHHTFPMDKFRQLAKCLTTNCRRTNPEGSNLSRPLVRSYGDFYRPLDLKDVPFHLWFEQPSGPIDPTFLNKFLQGRLSVDEARRIGFREQTPRKELIERTVLEVVGTILTCQLALKHGIASNVAGGTHHATPTSGAGYTILNDLAIASNYLTNPSVHQGDVPANIQKVLVVDCDVHQGDGTAKFGRNGDVSGENAIIDQDRMVTLSVHCEDNYPRPKAQSTYDVGLPKNMEDGEYLQHLKEAVHRAYDEQKPNFVLYDAGVDIYRHDTLGNFKVSWEGMRQRDRFVLDFFVSRGIPIAAVVGGGYDKNVDALARRHAIVHEECAFQWRKRQMWQHAAKENQKEQLTVREEFLNEQFPL